MPLTGVHDVHGLSQDVRVTRYIFFWPDVFLLKDRQLISLRFTIHHRKESVDKLLKG
jgi:hypothetical protein